MTRVWSVEKLRMLGFPYGVKFIWQIVRQNTLLELVK